MILQPIKRLVRLSKWLILKEYIFSEEYLYKKFYSHVEIISVFLTKEPKRIYQCQWASPFLVNKIITHQISASSDQHWQDFGFKTKREYEYWSLRICAIACVKMVLNYFNIEEDKLMSQLTEDCLRLGGYDIQHDKGWFHSAIINYLKHNKLKTSQLNFVSWSKLIKLLRKNTILISSISEKN